MGLQCVSEDNILLPPVKLDYSSGLSTPPFILNGSPMSNRPTSLPNSGEFRRKPTQINEYNEDNYYTIDLNTENIIGQSLGNTTLRYESQTYTLNYIAIHASIWSEGQEVSMVFTSPEFAILHICIPINLTNSDEDVNPFLTHWLYDDSMPPGFTVNELLNFSQSTVSFAGIQYCLQYNNKNNVTPYTIFMFNTSHNVNVTKCPAWITKLSSSEGNMRKKADQIFNLMMHGQVKYFSRDKVDPRLISVESHFSNERTQNLVKPVIYSVKRETLYKKKKVVEGFGMALQNVKCYPINLNTQIDENGQVIIDQTTNKPLDLATVKSNPTDPNIALKAQYAAQENNNSIRYIVIYVIIVSIFSIIILVLVLYLWRGSSVTPEAPKEIPTNVSNAARSAANAAASRNAANAGGPSAPG